MGVLATDVPTWATLVVAGIAAVASLFAAVLSYGGNVRVQNLADFRGWQDRRRTLFAELIAAGTVAAGHPDDPAAQRAWTGALEATLVFADQDLRDKLQQLEQAGTLPSSLSEPAGRRALRHTLFAKADTE
jgi:hypothetical protein